MKKAQEKQHVHKEKQKNTILLWIICILLIALLAYPIVYFPRYPNSIEQRGERFDLASDDTAVENWWGAQTYPTIITDMRNGLVTQQLLDGTYFSMAFPNWPELGTPCEDAGPSPSELTPIWFYTLVYFYDEIAIPTGNSVTVEAHYQCSRLPGSLLMDELTFAPCADGIPFQSHTLIIGKAENVDILQQNLGLNLSSRNCTVELDPTRTDYSFQFGPK